MMRIGVLLSDSLPTPTLPCHPPHSGGIILILKICKLERGGSGSSIEGHVTTFMLLFAIAIISEGTHFAVRVL